MSRTRALSILLFLLAMTSPLKGDDPKPADLVDLAQIKALTLIDLAWQEESRQQIGDVLVIGGSWTGPHFVGYNANFEEVEIDLTEYATIFLPVTEPPGTEIHQVVSAMHTESGAQVDCGSCRLLAGALPIAFLNHGEKAQDWLSLGFSGRGPLTNMSYVALQLRNPCEPNDYRFGNFGLALAETNMMALTLLSRVLQDEGYVPGSAAMTGGSKEGFAVWLASAVDDRVVVAGPGAFHREDFVAAFDAMEDNWGCQDDPPDGGTADSLAFRNWGIASHAGQVALKYFSVVEFAPELKPEFLFITGDVGLYGMHDAKFFTTGAETGFLESFSARPFRYDRRPTSSGHSIKTLELLTHYLFTGDVSAHPKVELSYVEMEATRFRAFAQVSPTPDAVRVWWSHSDDRPFDDQGNAPWVDVSMTLDGGVWASPWVDIPVGEMIGWYVEAENTLVWGAQSVPRRDTSPQRFFHEFPPLQCPNVPFPDCPMVLTLIKSNEAWGDVQIQPEPNDPNEMAFPWGTEVTLTAFPA